MSSFGCCNFAIGGLVLLISGGAAKQSRRYSPQFLSSLAPPKITSRQRLSLKLRLQTRGPTHRSLMTIIIIVMIPTIVVMAETSQQVLEGPAGHLFALLPSRFICEAEVNALVDTGVDHFLPRV